MRSKLTLAQQIARLSKPGRERASKIAFALRDENNDVTEATMAFPIRPDEYKVGERLWVAARARGKRGHLRLVKQ